MKIKIRRRILKSADNNNQFQTRQHPTHLLSSNFLPFHDTSTIDCSSTRLLRRKSRSFVDLSRTVTPALSIPKHMPLSACRGACYLANSAIDRRIHEITAESNFQKRTGRVYGSNDSRDYRASAPGCVAY